MARGFSNAAAQLYSELGDFCVKHHSGFRGGVAFRAVARAVVAVLVLEMLPALPRGLSSRTAMADEAAPPASGAPFTTPPVPNFTPNNLSQISSVVSQCGGQMMADSLVALAACGGPSTEYEAEGDLSCATLTPASVQAEKLKIQLAVTGQQCKKGLTAQARGKIECLQQGANLLQAMIGQQRAQFEKEIQAAQSALGQMEQIKKGFEEQDKTIGTRLNGDRDSGAPGLIEADQKMSAFIEEMQGPSGRVEQFKSENRALVDKKKFLLEQVQARTLELTTSCLAKGGNSGKRFQCRPNTPDVDYFTYLGCLYEASFSVGEGGRIERTELSRRQGQANVTSLGRALQDMLQSIPRSIAAAPSSPQQLDRLASGTDLWFTFDDFKQGISTRLSKFENKNFRISDRLLSKAEGCFNDAKVLVSKERRGAAATGSPSGQGGPSGGSPLVTLQNEVKDREGALNSKGQKIFTESRKAYSDAVRVLLGRNYNLPVEQCVGAKPSVQSTCMDQIVTNFEDLYLGKSEASKINMVIPGNGAVNALTIQCAGIKGCLADLQAQHSYLKSTVDQVKQAKQKYAAEANQRIDAMRTSLARAMSFGNNMVIQQQEALNKFLSSLGVSGSVQLDDVEGKAFEKDDNEAMEGLYKNPVGDDFLAAIGAGSTPPLKKLGKDSFKDAFSGLNEADKAADKKIGKLNALTGKMDAALAKCEGEKTDKALAKTQQIVDREIKNLDQCRKGTGRWCTKEQQEKFSDLMANLDGITGIDDDGLSDSLKSGSDICRSKLVASEGVSWGNDEEACSALFDGAYERSKSAVDRLKRTVGRSGVDSVRSGR